jgi:glycosyltransferase involved in cell wall biosynthesis
VAGFFRGTLGLGAAARAYVDALAAAGVPLTTTTVDLPTEAAGDPESGYAHVEFEDRSHAGPPMFNLICVNPDELPAFAEAVGEGFWAGRRSIGVWAWETDHIPERWQRAEGYVDEIWTYTRYVAQNIGRMAPVPVIPIPIPVVAPPPAPDPFAGELPDGFRFLFVFDLFSTIQRKNPIGLIEAFRRAFRPGEGPQLVVKTLHGVNRPQEFDELRWAARDRPDVFIVDRSLSAAERDGLMASCDCYISLHRSEGFGLTLAEAMAIGKPVIGTAYSGNLDFMTPANSYLVSYRPTRVGPRGEQYPADGWWAEPDLDHASTLMRRVWECPDEARRRGEQGRADIARDLSPEVVGRIARARLERLAPRCS